MVLSIFQMTLRGTQGFLYYDQDFEVDSRLPMLFTTTDLLNWKNHTSPFTEKPQTVVDLIAIHYPDSRAHLD